MLLSTAARRRAEEQQATSVQRGKSMPAPVGGLNKRDALAQMAPIDAVTMDNIFPLATYVVIRKGHASHATGMGSSNTIRTLMDWAGPASSKLKAAVNGNIYDVTSAGAVGAAELSSLSGNDWQFVNFTTTGGSFLVCCNGADSVRNYDGTSWTTPSITGVTSANLINVTAHKARLWFVEKDTMSAWFLGASSIAGAATKLDIGAQATEGGYLVAIGTISRDSGDGPDDYTVFVTSMGQVIVYEGTDPTSATTWAIVGVYKTGFPIGRRCLIKTGGDLGILCSDGVVSLNQLMNAGREVAQRVAITAKIQTLFNEYVKLYSANAGWQCLVYPRSNMAIFNIPVSSTEYRQLVLNTITGAWCQFKSLNGFCWGLLSNNLYFGATNGVVYKADTGYQDNGGTITAYLQPAWNTYGASGRQKMFTLIRPVIQTDGAPDTKLIMNVDFNVVAPTGSISVSAPSNSLWGSATWGSGVWGGDGTLVNQWNAAQAVGVWGSPNYIVTTNGASFALNSYDVQMSIGGAL